MSKLKNIIDDITTHPSMWVKDGKFDSAIAFICGYNWALKDDLNIDREETELGEFFLWLINDLTENNDEIPSNLIWEMYIGIGQDLDDSEKFTLLRELFTRFQMETGSNNHQKDENSNHSA